LATPAILLHEESDGRRHEERRRGRLSVRRLDSRPANRSLKILDLSLAGILLETDQPLGIDSYLTLEMPDGVAKICKTVWNNGKFYGATFSEPLTDAELRELISSSSVIWPIFGVGTQPALIEPPIHRSLETTDDPCSDQDEKLPIGVRLMITIGTSAALWTLIGVCIWLALQ